MNFMPENLYIISAAIFLLVAQFIIFFYFLYKMKRQRNDLLEACILLKEVCRKEVKVTTHTVDHITSVYDKAWDAINNCK